MTNINAYLCDICGKVTLTAYEDLDTGDHYCEECYRNGDAGKVEHIRLMKGGDM